MAARVQCLLKIESRRRFFIKHASAVRLLQCCSSSSSDQRKFSLQEHLINRIKASGPLTVAAFMQEVLTNPVSGYYMNSDVFGQAGDFITSPEISQVFGELIGVWFVHQWMLSGKKDVQLVELGPGRGTLAADVLRVFCKFPELNKRVSLHLVELSPMLSQIQEKALTQGVHSDSNHRDLSNPMNETVSSNINDEKGASLSYKKCVSATGVAVSWYRAVEDVPPGNCFYLAHEFFDALPIHQFQKTDKGWREVLVDITSHEGSSQLRFVLAPGPTLASGTLVPPGALGSHIEVCPLGGFIVEHMSSVLARHGGCALIVDYGEDGTTRHTLRAFKKHKLHDILIDPGDADVTANVDFAYLRKAIRGQVQTFGPVTQSSFLTQMGINTRMEVLIRNADVTQADQLRSGYKMLMSAEEMGEKFKFFSLVQHGLPEPAAFK